METVTLSLEQLQPGLVIDQDIYTGAQMLLKSGTEVTADLLIRLRQRNIESINISRGSRLARILAEPEPSSSLAETSNAVLFKRHGIKSAVPEELLEEATNEVQNFFQQIELGGNVEVDPMRDLVRGLVGHMLANPDGAPKLFSLKSFDAYTYRHSINVGLLMLLVVRDWGLSEDLMNEIVLGGLLHDLGKLKVGSEIINKNGPLDDNEWLAMKMHPLWSLELLGEHADLPPEALSLIRSHHERMDGRGYPHGVKAGELDRFARLSAVCDVYDALTSRRSYKGKIEFAAAVNILLESSGTHFDSTLLNAFVRRIGLYPVGTLVKLNNGETAIVVRTNPDMVTRPIVSPVISPLGQAYQSSSELNLAEERQLFITGPA